MERVESKKNRFLKLTPENGDYNQYWFSEKTIEFFVNQVNKYGKEKIGFIATPSIFFSLSKEMQNKSYLFDIDEKLTKKHKNGKRYDFNESDYEVKFLDLKNLLDLDMKVFQPSIPHLVYQYNIFANYDDEELNKKNPEIPE